LPTVEALLVAPLADHEQALCKAALDKAVLTAMKKAAKKGQKVEPLPNWTLHDLRRTAKTLMVRAGVRPDISERVLGHVIAGVEGTYDRHSYADEKRVLLKNQQRWWSAFSIRHLPMLLRQMNDEPRRSEWRLAPFR
jgi:integrase